VITHQRVSGQPNNPAKPDKAGPSDWDAPHDVTLATSDVAGLDDALAAKATNVHAHADADLPAGLARDTEVAAAVAGEAGARALALTTHADAEVIARDAAIAAHEAAANPHPDYLTAVEGAAAYRPIDYVPTHAETTGRTANDHHAQLHAAAHATGQADALAAAAIGAATPADVAAAIAALVNAAPGTLDTLNELAVALGNDANFAATITAALAGKQPLHADLTAYNALTKTPYGLALMALADAAAGRTALGLGTAALSAATAFDVAGAAAAAQAASQPLDSDLSAIAALATTAYGRSLLAAVDAAALRTLGGVEVPILPLRVGPPSIYGTGFTGMPMVANTVYVQWFVDVPRPVAITRAEICLNVQSGNLDIAVVDATKNRLVSTGAVACPGGGGQYVNFTTGMTLQPGTKYGAAIQVDNTTVRVIGTAVPGASAGFLTDVGIGFTATPGSLGIPAVLGSIAGIPFLPWVAFS
jgi:hypothetical protein